jgi:photosystem II stability/assembly factor-like uncharacterized protein
MMVRLIKEWTMAPLRSGTVGRFLVTLGLLLASIGTTPAVSRAEGGWATGWPGGQPSNGITALVAHPTDPSMAFAGTSAGLYRTGNAGANWSRIGSLTNVVALAIAPAGPNTLYAFASAAASSTLRLWRSDDGGQSWNIPAPTADMAEAGASVLLVDRTSTTTLLSGTGASGARSGQILRSTDGGTSWHQVYAVSSLHTTGGITALVQAPSDGHVFYAGHDVYHGGVLLRSEDGGETWRALPMPDEPLFFPVALAAAPDDTRVVSVALQAPTGAGVRLYRSGDGGQTWAKVGTGLPDGAASASALAIDPSDRHRLFLAIQGPSAGVYASGDDGSSWARLGGSAPPPTAVGKLAIAASGQPLYAGSGNGVWQYAAPAPSPGIVDPHFAAYYDSHDGIRVLGRPISGLTVIDGYPAQYFEKGRIEDHARETPDPTWRFMYGLLVDQLHQRQASLPVGGDVSTVSYATLHQVASPVDRVGPPAGFRGGVAALADGSVFVPFTADLSPAAGHTVPACFWGYLNRRDYFPAGWLHDVGLPITEPVRAVVDKGPVKGRTIVLQAFQRTVLTDDPLNLPGWQVERANVGSDYLQVVPVP